MEKMLKSQLEGLKEHPEKIEEITLDDRTICIKYTKWFYRSQLRFGWMSYKMGSPKTLFDVQITYAIQHVIDGLLSD